jgi:predicted  nucleic acid-binding Zn-ribbon protein
MAELDQLKEKLKKVDAEENEYYRKYEQCEKQIKALEKEEKDARKMLEVKINEIRQKKEKIDAERREWWRKVCDKIDETRNYRVKIADMEAKKKK